MKKIIFLLLVVFSTITVSAQELWCRASKVKVANNDLKIVVPWKPVDMPVYIDLLNQRIEIYSQKTQIIDFYDMMETPFSDGLMYSAYGTDTDYRTIYVVIFLFDSGITYLEVNYSDLHITYNLVPASD